MTRCDEPGLPSSLDLCERYTMSIDEYRCLKCDLRVDVPIASPAPDQEADLGPVSLAPDKRPALRRAHL